MLPQQSLLLGFLERDTESKHRLQQAQAFDNTDCLHMLKKLSLCMRLVVSMGTRIYTRAYACIHVRINRMPAKAQEVVTMHLSHDACLHMQLLLR